MHVRSRPIRAAAVVAVSALVLVACGDDDSDTGASSDETTEEPTDDGGGAPTGDGTLTIGALLPQTGDLAFLGPPEFAGVDLAVEEINAAGGVLGQDVESLRADSGDGTPNIAPQETDNLLDGGTDVVVGAASSSVSLSVIDKITGAGVVHYSPANTSTAFDTYDDGGLYFRTAPSDVLQGAVMANLVAEDGNSNIAILARQDSYGEALAKQVEKVFTQQGGTVAESVLYDANASTYNAEVNQIAGSNPDAVVLIAFNETERIIPQMIAAGVGPQDVPVYFVDGNLSNEYDFERGTLEGVKGTLPGAAATNDFQQRLLDVNPRLEDFSYAPESYDAVVTSALAAIVAGDDAGEAIAQELQGVTEGGTVCTTFEECAQLAEDGEDLDYNGVSGPIEMGDTGSPTAATIGIYEYGPDNTYTNLEYIEGQI